MSANLLKFYAHRIINGDIYSALRCAHIVENNSIDCVITSPPYWSQRDYGFPFQIGNEKTFNEYIQKLITVFDLLKKKINEKGIFYLNIGDKYINKYGNTSLGMIPYKLAYYMVQDGWNLEDIIIWYKPNHMPSSVKNRFTNTYEPVFVFSKSKINYYSEYKKDHVLSNILRVPLQPTQYTHVATYPEKLVEQLIQLGIPENGVILDPFAGSGTTCKAVLNLNQRKGYNLNSIMIEAQEEYVKIIKERCEIQNENISIVEYADYKLRKLDFESNSVDSESHSVQIHNIDLKSSIIKVTSSTNEFEEFMKLLSNRAFFDTFLDEGVVFFGLPDHKIEKIYRVALSKKWIIRNMLVVPQNKDWIPIFMLVKDIKSIEYKFDIDKIRVGHQFEINENWNDTDFIGYKVVQNAIYFKEPISGMISQIISKKSNGLPHWVIVQWENSKFTLEEVLNYPLEDKRVIFYCPFCSNVLQIYYHSNKETKCQNCNQILWKDIPSIPKLELNPRKEPKVIDGIESINKSNELTPKNTKKSYNGKFKNTLKINMGQSPGARASTSEQYFSVQRYFDVEQPLICDYLNLHRIKKGLSKNRLTELFPLEYKHTVGHWLRKDMGGSLPKEEDLMRLKEILDLDETYVDYINRKGLKLQTILKNNTGKNPGDLLDYPLGTVISMLKKAIN